MNQNSSSAIHSNVDCQTHQKRYYSSDVATSAQHVSDLYYYATIFTVCISLIIPYCIPIAGFCLYKAKKCAKLAKQKGGKK